MPKLVSVHRRLRNSKRFRELYLGNMVFFAQPGNAIAQCDKELSFVLADGHGRALRCNDLTHSLPRGF